MNMIAEHLDPHAFAEGSEAYIRYCSGIAVMQFPADFIVVHNFPEVEESVREISVFAERMMVDAIQRIIKVSHPDEHVTLKAAEKEYETAEPAMREIVSHACDFQEGRLAQLNDMYPILRPAAFLMPTVYRAVCHGKSVSTMDMMDGFNPDPIFFESSVLDRG